MREFQTQLLHYFSKSDNDGNHHHWKSRETPSLVSRDPLSRPSVVRENPTLLRSNESWQSRRVGSHKSKFWKSSTSKRNSNFAYISLLVFLSLSLFLSLGTSLLSKSLPLLFFPRWCVRCLLITERPKTPCHYRYQI